MKTVFFLKELGGGGTIALVDAPSLSSNYDLLASKSSLTASSFVEIDAGNVARLIQSPPS